MELDAGYLFAVDVPDTALWGPVEAVDGPVSPENVAGHTGVPGRFGDVAVAVVVGWLIGVLDLVARISGQDFKIGFLDLVEIGTVFAGKHGCDCAGAA